VDHLLREARRPPEFPEGEGEDPAGSDASGEGAKERAPPGFLRDVVQNPERDDAVETLVGEVAQVSLENDIRAQQSRTPDARQCTLGFGEKGCARVDPAVQKGCTELESEEAREAAAATADVEDRGWRPLSNERQERPPARPGSPARLREELRRFGVEDLVQRDQRACSRVVHGVKRSKRGGALHSSRAGFDPRSHEAGLLAVLAELAATPDWDARALDALLRRNPRSGRGLFSRSELLAGLAEFSTQLALGERQAELALRLRRRRVRTLSGVAPVTVFTRPHPCPGRCIFCPTDVRMPKSYLPSEPGCQRAAQYAFDPFEQTLGRLRDYQAIGHAVDKVELIVLGGTWSAYPTPYRIWFVKRCLDALNKFGVVEPLPDASEHSGWPELEAAQRANESAALRCVGLSLETRPDHISRREVLDLRRLGATKIQLGLQSLSDEVLLRNARGHGVAESQSAMTLLRSAGFKLHVHWMPNLLGSTPGEDLADFERLFLDPALRPDELKVYPCFLIDGTELVAHWRSGAWHPYSDDELVMLLADCMARTPRWCRLTRIVRDISAGDILAGSKTANLRELAEARLRETGRVSSDIRAREIRGDESAVNDVLLRETEYAAAGGRELFIEADNAADRLLGFARLWLPGEPAWIDELRDAALLRELHVYGTLAPLGIRGARHTQHRGLGQRLLARAVERARTAGFKRLAVISAVGTRLYYERHGFRPGALYQSLDL